MRMRALLVILSTLAVACNSPVAPTATLQAFTVTTPLDNKPLEVTATGSAGKINIAGSIQTGDGCQTVTGTLVRVGDDMGLQVTARRTSTGVCTAAVVNFHYAGVITGLTSGTYRVQVTHDDNGVVTIALTSSVVIP